MNRPAPSAGSPVFAVRSRKSCSTIRASVARGRLPIAERKLDPDDTRTLDELSAAFPAPVEAI